MTISNNGKTLTNEDGVNFECSFGVTHGIYIGEEYTTTMVENINNQVYEMDMKIIVNEDGSITTKKSVKVDGVANEAMSEENVISNGKYEANAYSVRFGEEIDAAIYASPDGNVIMMDGYIFVKK